MTVLAGQIATADDINDVEDTALSGIPRYKFKASNQTFTSNTTYANDADFGLTIAAGQLVKVELCYAVTATSTGDAKVQWVSTGTVAQLGTRMCHGPDLATADVTNTNVRVSRHNIGTSVNYGMDTATAAFIHETLMITGGASGGTLTPQIAQNSAAGTTSFTTSSFVVVTEIQAL